MRFQILEKKKKKKERIRDYHYGNGKKNPEIASETPHKVLDVLFCLFAKWTTQRVPDKSILSTNSPTTIA
jgi:hypothetical protein